MDNYPQELNPEETMKLNYIDINGVAYPVVFTMLTMTNFEAIINKGFFKADWNKTTERMALIIAAALAADENTKLNIETLRGKDSFDDYKQIVTAFNVVMTMANEFFEIPAVEKDKDPNPTDGEQEQEDGAKN